MYKRRRKFVSSSNSLTMFVGDSAMVSSALVLDMVRMHQDEEGEVRTYYFSADTEYSAIVDKVRVAFRKESGIFIFERADDHRLCALMLNLIECGFAVWVGMNSSSAEAAIKDFERVLFHGRTPKDALLRGVESDAWIHSVWSRFKRSSALLEVIDLRMADRELATHC